MKGTYLKNLTVAPDAPVPSPPRSSKSQPPTRGLLPAAAQLAARQLLGHWAGQREERMQSAPRQQQETSDSIRSWAKSALESLERGSTALRQICSKYRVCWAPALWHSHSDSDPRIRLVYLMGLLKQQIYKHTSPSEGNIWVSTRTLVGITFLFQIQTRLWYDEGLVTENNFLNLIRFLSLPLAISGVKNW